MTPPLVGAVRRLFRRLPAWLTDEAMHLAGRAVLVVALAIAAPIGIALLVLCLGAVALLGTTLRLPNAVLGPLLLAGFVVPLVVTFVVLVRLYRRLPRWLTLLLNEEPVTDESPRQPTVDPKADPATLAGRVAALDRRLAAPPPPQDHEDAAPTS